jgi:cytochrome c biogenesis protein CcdA/thiol-disulfide isomerase/thioredoxin
MILLLLFAFLAGVITILSPCILPILPIVLSSTIGDHQTSKRRPLGVVFGFITSFTFFTLFLSTIVKQTGIPGDSLRFISVIVIAGFGISFLIPQVQSLIEKGFTKLAQFAPQSQNRTGFFGGIIVGLSLGLLWTPCVGPILASVISLALTGSVTSEAIFITLAYAIGTAIPMFVIMYGGRTLLQRVPWLLTNTDKLQKAFGVVMIITAIGILNNVDRKFQTFILNTFPQYGTGLTKLEDIKPIREQLNNLNKGSNKTSNVNSSPENTSSLPRGPLAPELIPGGQWFNTQPLTLKQLKGKVVIIDFWTYSCINCQRTLPYLRNWWQKYKDMGLVIIGVHAPEFEFEKNPKNVAQALKDFQLIYPVMQDNDFATWRAYDNHYWPAKYIIDKDGYIRYTHFGEGEYNQTEQVIQTLLKETGATKLPSKIDNPTYTIDSKTPETYLGYARLQNFASPESISQDQQATYTTPETLPNDSFAYSGDWLLTKEYAVPQKGAKLSFNFDSKEVYLVMRPKDKAAKIKIFVDNKQQYAGTDNKNGTVTVDSDRLYKLIRLPSPGRHTLRLEFEDNNAELFAFTFG